MRPLVTAIACGGEAWWSTEGGIEAHFVVLKAAARWHTVGIITYLVLLNRFVAIAGHQSYFIFDHIKTMMILPHLLRRHQIRDFGKAQSPHVILAVQINVALVKVEPQGELVEVPPICALNKVHRLHLKEVLLNRIEANNKLVFRHFNRKLSRFFLFYFATLSAPGLNMNWFKFSGTRVFIVFESN